MNPDPRGRWLLIVASVVVVASVVAGLLLLGSPQNERRRRLDQARLTDLVALRAAIEAHYRREGALPDSLEALARRSPLPVRMTDPVGGRLYDYEAIDSTHYRLCAIFDFATEAEELRPYVPEWAHGAGRQCFRISVPGSGGGPARIEPEPLLEGAAGSVP